MVKGSKKDEIISYEDILQKTSGGYDIYMAYEGKVSKTMKHPWRKDNHSSFGIYPHNGIYFWKDIAKETSGTAVDYVMNKFLLTYKQAIDKIAWDFGLGKREVNANPVKITWEHKEPEPPIHISFTTQPFQQEHHSFWNCAGASESDCNKMECWALKDLAIRRKRFNLRRNEAAFAFYCPEEDKVKIYLPDRAKDYRFYNNVSFFHLWNAKDLGKCENLVVNKSNKDMIIASLLTPCVIATQAEQVKIFSEDTVETINSLGEHIFMAYGSDDDGKEKSIKITKEFGWKWVNPPNKFLPEANDLYLLSKLHGIQEVEKLFKHKKII